MQIVNKPQFIKAMSIICTITLSIGALVGYALHKPEVVVKTETITEVVTEYKVVEKPIHIVVPEEPVEILGLPELSEDDLLAMYMMEYGVNENRAYEIIDIMNMIGTTVPKTLMLGHVQRETDFRNVHHEKISEDDTEDSAGYVQMQSETREWLRKHVDPTLPEIKDQDHFIQRVDAQFMYLATYLEYARNRYEGDFTLTVSSYNMGLGNTDKGRINYDYVEEVSEHKLRMDEYVNP